MSYKDPIKAAQYRKEYYSKNMVVLKQKMSEYIVKNRLKRKEYLRKWASENRDKCLTSGRKNNAKRRAMVMELKSKGCMDCGEKDVRVIQLHAPNGHLEHGGDKEGKNRPIGDGSRFSFGALKKELQIVIPLCANCHIRRHCDIRGIHNQFPKIQKDATRQDGSMSIP
jgi:hypothetical protein